MSGESAQSQAAGEQSQWQARLAQSLSSLALPELQQITGSLTGMLNNRDASGMMAPDAAIKQSATNQLNASYGQALRGSQENIAYQGLRSGGARTDPGAYGSAITSAATSLDRDRSSALRNLEFMSAQSSMQDYNQVLQLLGQSTKQGLSLAGGFAGASGQAIAGLSGASPLGSTLGGAASGAAAGAQFGPYGAVAGGIIGGAGGYAGSR